MPTYNTVSVSGNNIFGNASGQVVSVAFTPQSFYFDTPNNTEINAPVATTVSNSSGAWTVSGIIDPTPDGSGMAWRITVNDKSNGQLLYAAVVQIAHANGASQNWLSLAPPPPPANVTTYLSTSSLATAAGQFLTSSGPGSNVLSWKYGYAPVNVMNFGADSTGTTDCSTAFANALTAAASVNNVLYIPPGTYKISTADSHGNGITLTAAGMTLQGGGFDATTIRINGTVTWGIQSLAAGVTVRDLTLDCGSSGIVTYGAGVDTPASNGSAELNLFENVTVNPGTGTMANGFAVGPRWTGTNTPDIAETYFIHCRSILPSNAGWLVGNGTVSQILNTYMIGCNSSHSSFGVLVSATNVNWVSGTLQKNTYDIYFTGPLSAAASRFTGLRSENSGRLLGCDTTPVGSGQLTLEDISWQSWGNVSGGVNPAANGDLIQWSHCGTLNLINVTLNTGLSSPYNVTPVISIGDTGSTHKALAINVTGLQAATTIANLISSTNQWAMAVVSGFVQLESTTNAPPASTLPTAPQTLIYSAVTATINGVTYQPMVQTGAIVSAAPYQTVTLASPAANINFNSIPAGYSNLRIVVVGASATAAESDKWGVTVNGSATGYDNVMTTGTGTPATNTATRANFSSWAGSNAMGDIPGASATAGVSGILEVNIPLYSGTTFQKTGFWRSGFADIATAAADSTQNTGTVAWRTTSAITSVRILLGTGANLVTGTTAYLYLS